MIERSEIGRSGDLNEIEFEHYDAKVGRFDNFVVAACHTTTRNLSRTFNENYYGTPRTVKDLVTFYTPSHTGWFPLRLNRTFKYNNANHLLIEIRWRGDNNVTSYTWSTNEYETGVRTIFSYNDTSQQAQYWYKSAYHLRLSFGYYTAKEPTSLGRVKAVFR